MKSRKLFLGVCLSLLFIGCDKDNDTQTTASDDARISADIDEMTDDVSEIIDEQFILQQNSGRIEQSEAALPDCASVTVTTTENTWTKTIDFGDGCEMPNGNILQGVIIISGSNNFDTPSHTINYSFVDFYHNNKLIQGNRTVTRSLVTTNAVPAMHPRAVMEIDMSVTFPNGNTYTRTGTRTREMIEGFDTPGVFLDNKFAIIGNWTTGFPNGNIHSGTIIEPLIRRMNCPRIVRGVVEIIRNGNTGILDYGEGECDNLATVTINGVETTITLGN